MLNAELAYVVSQSCRIHKQETHKQRESGRARARERETGKGQGVLWLTKIKQKTEHKKKLATVA